MQVDAAPDRNMLQHKVAAVWLKQLTGSGKLLAKQSVNFATVPQPLPSVSAFLPESAYSVGDCPVCFLNTRLKYSGSG